MKKLFSLAALLCFFAFFTSGCFDSGQKGSSSSKNNGSVSTPTEEEIPNAKVEAIGKKLESDFKTNPANVTIQFIDSQKIFDIVKKSPNFNKLSRKDKNDMEKVFTQENQREQMAAQMATQLKGATLSYSGVHRADGYVNAVMRMEPAEGGINYWLVRCVKKGSDVVAEDLYIATNGGTSNELIAGTMTDLLELLPGLLNKSDKKFNNRIALMGKMSTAIKTKQFASAMKTYEDGHCENYKMFSMDLVYLQALQQKIANIDGTSAEASQISDKMQKTVESISSYKPGYFGGNIFLIDAYITQKNDEKIKQTLENLRKALGPDSYLDFLEGNSYFISGEKEKALACFKTAGRKGLRSIHYLVSYYLVMKNTPGSSEVAMQKIKETGTELYGSKFSDLLESQE